MASRSSTSASRRPVAWPRWARPNVAEMTAFLSERQIRCDYEPTGRLMVALTAAHLDEAARTVETARRLGLDSFRLLDRAAEQPKCTRRSTWAGWRSRAEGFSIRSNWWTAFAPRPSAVASGCTKHSRVTRAQDSRRVGSRADGSRVRGGTAHRAGDERVYPPAVAGHPSSIHSALRLHPGERAAHAPRQHDAIGWRRRQGVTDGRTFFNYYRLTGTTGCCGARARRPTTPVTGSARPTITHRPTMPPSERASTATFRRSSDLACPMRGAAHLLDHPDDAVLRAGARRTPELRPGLHWARPGHDASGRSHPGAPGARAGRATCWTSRWCGRNRFRTRPSRSAPGPWRR